ncbi:Uncharacterised protein [Mycoplasmopsis citelli]|uniref:Uncharacterized protein n=1 Tax=Mycoplasmopsis citelli TaxID=171281 RepID=A0A449B2L0_9BACT|nr:hypothetical protein [Mycoplasmopsis citelli]VEU74764.1 Uncharacterised protein [Mycoplasmopsis citelli]
MKKALFKKILLTIPLTLSVVATSASCSFFEDLKTKKTPPTVETRNNFAAVNLSDLKLLTKYVDFNDKDTSPHRIVPITEEETFLVNQDNLTDQEKEKILKELNSTVEDFQKVEEKEDTDKRFYLQFVEPYTGVAFKEYSYATDENGVHRYMLGKNALVKFAQEFKRKVPFGPEVHQLQGININDFTVIPASANGVYVTQNKNIYLNGYLLLEKGIGLYAIMSALMGTLFHEYIHHWANSYAQVGLLIDKYGNSKDRYNNARIIYHGASEENHGSEVQLWNGYFTEEFKNLLNWNVNLKADLSGNRSYDQAPQLYKNKYLSSIFSPSELWTYANSYEDKFNLLNDANILYSTDGNFKIGPANIKYIYSLTESVAREYTKYAFENYYQLNSGLSRSSEENKNYFFSWFGSTIGTNDRVALLTYGAGNDWLRTYLTPSTVAYTNKGFNQDDYLAFPNTVFPFNYKGRLTDNNQDYDSSRLYTLKEEFKNNRSKPFYKLFLDTMGYGKAIAQIFPKTIWKWEDKITDTHKLHEKLWTDSVARNFVKFSGYLKDKQESGFAIVSSNGNITSTKFQYQDTFNFFGKSAFDQGASILDPDEREEQLQTRLYPDADEVYYPYTTDNYVNLKENDKIYFWKDLNNDGKAQRNEIDFKKAISIPKFRRVTNNQGSDGASNKDIYLENENGTITAKII